MFEAFLTISLSLLQYSTPMKFVTHSRFIKVTGAIKFDHVGFIACEEGANGLQQCVIHVKTKSK